ncbi:MAG: hypothetical protein CFE43_13515 [Burkholderiales bacterium PBB3]|nr:MAG: hypothetical protein CFE43_13515 [Burkholderiales bacterium PBB3]
MTVSTRNASQEVVINAPLARYAADASGVDMAQLPWRELAVALPAVGLVCQVTPHASDKAHAVQQPADRCSIRFQSADAAKLESLGLPAAPVAVVVIDSVPLPVARAFQSFAAQMGMWVERVEQRVQLEREAEQRKKEDEAAAVIAAEAAAQKAADKAAGKAGQSKEDYSQPVSDEIRQERIDKQIAALRKTAGFKGSSSEFGADPGGKLQWFVDLDGTGRVILQSGNRSFNGSLKGAKITALTGELEVGVRDALWSEDESQLSNFNIMAGTKPEIRLAWKERLEILIRSLR